MIKVLPIGIGLGGSNYAKEISTKLKSQKGGKNSKYGEPIYVNICADELGMFNTALLNGKFHVGTMDGGAGKNRDLALDTFADKFDYDKLIDLIRERVIEDDIDVVATCFTTGGGTGSGIGPALTNTLFNLMEQQTDIKYVSVIGFALLPSFDEGITIHKNNLLALGEIETSFLNGGRYALVKNTGEGSSFNDRRTTANKTSITLFMDYVTGSHQSKTGGVLDLNDKRVGLAYPGLHSFNRLRECNVDKSPFVEPGSNKVKHVMAEIPEENCELYEEAVLAGVHLDYKFGYTSDEVGVVAFHGFNSLRKETVAYRKRFDELKELDSADDVGNGVDSLNALKKDVFHYNIRKNNVEVVVGEEIPTSKKLLDSFRTGRI